MYKKHVKDADILLFRAPKFPKAGWWISKLSYGKYSHVAIAIVEDGELFCIEFREFKTSRKYKVSDYIKNGAVIDVFRVSPSVQKLQFNNHTEEVETLTHIFNEHRVIKILERAEYMIGRKYNWSSIKNIWFTYMPLVRWLTRSDHTEKNGKDHVCSSFVSYLLRRYYVDPCQFLTDSYTKPSDLARSNILNYLFTLD